MPSVEAPVVVEVCNKFDSRKDELEHGSKYDQRGVVEMKSKKLMSGVMPEIEMSDQGESREKANLQIPSVWPAATLFC